MSGNGQQFIFILKDILKELTSELNAKFEEVSKIAGAVTDAPEEMDAQLKNCKIEERRIGTAISFILTWDYSDVENYDSAEIYIKEAQGDIATPIQWDTLEYSKIIRTTKTNTYTVTGINAGYVYQITFLAKNTFGSVSDKSEAPTLIYAVSALNNVPDPPLDFNVYFTRDGVLWKWTQPADLDYAYAELRTDDDAGDADGLLEITQDTTSTALPPYREGTAYLFNKGYGDRYSNPITSPWSKPVPTAPQDVVITPTWQGLQISYSQIPEDCIGVVISINGLKHYSSDDVFNFYCSTGTYTVKVCYYDCFGEGIWTREQTVGTIEEIPPDAIHITDQVVFDNGVIVGSYIGDHEIVGTKIKDGTITTQNIAAGTITGSLIASNAVTTDKIEADAITSDKIQTGAITADKIKSGAITSDKLTAGAVTADKLAANEIEMAGELKIVGGAVTLDENGLNVETSTGSKVQFGSNGMIFVDTAGNTFSGIGRFCTGNVNDGNTVTFRSPWDIVPSVFVFPTNLQTSAVGYSNVNILQQVAAINVTKSGFSVICRSVLKSGSNGYVSLNNTFLDESDPEDQKTAKYTFSVPASATSTNVSYTISNTIYGDSGRVYVGRRVQVYVSWESGGTVIAGEELVMDHHTIGNIHTLTRNFTKQLSFKNITSITMVVRITTEKGGDVVEARSHSAITINNYTVNTAVDTIIARGSAGFIAIDPNTCPFTVT